MERLRGLAASVVRRFDAADDASGQGLAEYALILALIATSRSLRSSSWAARSAKSSPTSVTRSSSAGRARLAAARGAPRAGRLPGLTA